METLAVAVLAVGAIGGVLTLALKALSSERRAGDAENRAAQEKAGHDIANVNMTSLAAQLADTANRLRDAEGRLDEFSSLLVQYAAGMPVAGAYDRLLARRQADRGAARGGGDATGEVPPRPEAGEHADRLLDPWSGDKD